MRRRTIHFLCHTTYANLLDSKIDFSTRRLYVGHLDNTVTEEMLYSLFSSFGPLKSVNLHLDLVTGLSSGFAFIKFANHADCKLAAERLNGYVFNGSAVRA